MYVITISGKARSGKTTMGVALKEYVEKHGKKAIVCQYGDFLKMVCENYFGWSRGDKSETGRALLQNIGTNLFRAANPDIWVNMMIELIKGLRGTVDVVIIPDARFRNEIVRVRDCEEIDGVFTVKIERDGYDNGLTEEQKNHPSETSLDDYTFDLIVKNNESLEDYIGKANSLWDHFLISCSRETLVI